MNAPVDPRIAGALPAEIRNRLLAPAVWGDPLTKYARATHLGVALVNREGQLIGEVFNAQPLWILLAKAAGLARPCPFSVSKTSFCTCIADGFARGKPVVVREDCGLVHFSAPLILNGYPVGSIIAGQVFDRHPEPFLLQSVAQRLGIDKEVWELARVALPVRTLTLQVYAELLTTLANAVLHEGYGAIQAERLAHSQARVERTEGALRNTRDELQALAARLLKVQEDERRRLAREIHDDMLQRLALLSIKLTNVLKIVPEGCADVRRQVTEIERDASSLSDDMRSIAYQLYPAKLEDLGLQAALKILVRESADVRSVPITFTNRWPPEPLPDEISLCLYRVAQEGLRNILRHAGNAPAGVILSRTASGVRLTVCDRGRGFDPALKESGGLGLISMKERVRLAGGRFRIRSRPGRGTSIFVVIPLFGPENT